MNKNHIGICQNNQKRKKTKENSQVTSITYRHRDTQIPIHKNPMKPKSRGCTIYTRDL